MTWVENARPEIEAESQWPMIVAVCVVLTVAMASTVGLRLYVRIRMIKSVGIDDYVMLASMVKVYCSQNSSIANYHTGLRNHLQRALYRSNKVWAGTASR